MDPEAAPLIDRILHARAEVLPRRAVREDLADRRARADPAAPRHLAIGRTGRVRAPG